MEKFSKENIVEKLREEIALIAGFSPKDIDLEKSLSENGLNSMGFVELTIAVEQAWKVSIMDAGLTGRDVASVNAFAEKIYEYGLQKKMSERDT